MNPKYSVLLCNQDSETYISRIDSWLHEGIKVIWIGKEKDVNTLGKKYSSFAKAFLFQTYVIDSEISTVIFDGDDQDSFVINHLQAECPQFNSAQYLVEHCKANENIIVQASAGTGKTTVMIDRIMYLLHTQSDLKLSDIFMITFTNDATSQMNHRLQQALMNRYELTGNEKYLRWLEEQSQIHISTIHSFALFLLKKYGIYESFTDDLKIRGFQFEKKNLIKDLIDQNVNERQSMLSQLGVPFYRADSLIDGFWNGFARLGISHEDMKTMDWGTPDNQDSVSLQKAITNIVSELDDEYFELKREQNAIAVEDIMRDLQQVLSSPELPETDVSMKYLFIDEFQDTDLSQIKVACMLMKILHTTLFVVGDIKQSIYRFRGATDQAFYILKKDMSDMNIKAPMEYTLVNNYRTAANILDRMDNYFKVWGQTGSLAYDKSVIPFNKNNGVMKMLHAPRKDDELDDLITKVASEQLNQLVQKVDENGIKPNEKTRVVILTRNNKDLLHLRTILRKQKIPASVRRDGSFYSSEAVRDFYMVVLSFMFPDEPKYIFNFLLTPYAGEIDPMNINDLEWQHADYESLVNYLSHFLNQTQWQEYYKQIRLKPIFSVFKAMMDGISVVDNYILNKKKVLHDMGWEEDRCNAQTFTSARQYQADLEKLLEILQRNFGGSKVSIYDIYKFLKINIATNRSEAEPNVDASDDYTSVLCMTVHKAKGLEFDTVILPYTNKSFPAGTKTEILIDPVNKRAGWNYNGDKENSKKHRKYSVMKNSIYDELKEKDQEAINHEEVRILYVAMTRAINNLICLVPESKNKNSWAHLIEEVGVDYE